MKRVATISAVIVTLLAGQAQAGHKGHAGKHGHQRHHNAITKDYAKVVSTTPLYRTVTHSQPRKECWLEEVRYEQPRHNEHRSATGTIVGTIVGAAIGNAIGHNKTNKKVGMVAGGILGASIGHDISKASQRRHSNSYSYQTGTEEVCRTTYDSYQTQELDGYQVVYRYHGQTYETRMDHRPGNRIKVRVKVTPVH